MIQLEDRSWWIFGASVPELHASSQKGVCSAKQRPNHADKYIVSNLDNYSCPKTSCKDCSCVPWWQRRTRNQRGFHNSSDLTHTHLNIGYLGWLRTTYHRQGNKLVTKRLWACLKAERRHRDHLRQRVTLTSSTLRKSPATDHEKDWTRRDCAYQGGFSAWKKLTASWQEIVDNQTDTIAIDMLRNKNDLTLLSITAVEPVGTQGFVLWARDSCELWYCTASKAVVKNMFQSTAQKRSKS